MEQPQRLLMVSMLVLSLTAIAIRAQASSETADNRKYTGIGSTAVTISTPNTDVSASRPVRFVQPNGLFGFFGTLRSIKKLYDEVGWISNTHTEVIYFPKLYYQLSNNLHSNTTTRWSRCRK